MSDLFHKNVPLEYIQQVFDVMKRAHWHRFQVLTKRSERLAELSSQLEWSPNIWMGVSVESQKFVNRIDDLRQTNAKIKFLSLEPLIGSLKNLELHDIDWAIVGGESGYGARPVHPDWVRSIRDQCVAADVPFFFKQWGNYGESHGCDDPCGKCVMALSDGTITGTDWVAGARMKGSVQLHPFGKKKAGRELDGRIWDEMPKILEII